MSDDQPDEPVRVGRFEWERLMQSDHSLARPIQGTLLVLGIYMSENGGDARPGVDNLVIAARKSRSTVIDHLSSAVDAGYLIVVERGGYRGGEARATEYAAAVPKQVWADRHRILFAPPWRRADDGSTSEKPDVRRSHERPKNRTFAQDQGPGFEDQGPVFTSRRSENSDPTTQLHHASTPPSLPAAVDTTAPPDTNPNQEGGREEIDPQTQKIKTLALETSNQRPGNPLWKPAHVEKAIRTCLANGKTLDQIERALPLCVADPDTKAPGRLPLDFPWWDTPTVDRKPPDAITEPANQRLCPHPEHPNQPALNCTHCRTEHKQGRDPFANKPGLRPPGWIAAYGYINPPRPRDILDQAIDNFRDGYLSDSTHDSKRSVLALRLRPIGRDAAQLIKQGMSEKQVLELATEAGRADIRLLEYAEQFANHHSTQSVDRNRQPRSSERTDPGQMNTLIADTYAQLDERTP